MKLSNDSKKFWEILKVVGDLCEYLNLVELTPMP
mgnify:CR=1 FL=1